MKKVDIEITMTVKFKDPESESTVITKVKQADLSKSVDSIAENMKHQCLRLIYGMETRAVLIEEYGVKEASEAKDES